MDGFKTIKPLSNFDVGDLCRSLPNFKGVFMRDQLKSQCSSRNECLVINCDIAANRGTHWVCLYAKNGINYYFDPYGLKPLPEVLNYCKKNVYSSTFPIQKPNEVICGHYCVYVLHRLSQGDEFIDVLKKLYFR